MLPTMATISLFRGSRDKRRAASIHERGEPKLLPVTPFLGFNACTAQGCKAIE
jgi:hypothetical protein